MGRLSVIVIAYNEEHNIERCLRSVQFADEVIVVDSFSADRTVEIARQLASDVIQHEFDGDIPQRERGFARAGGDWLVYIDADEEVSDELGKEILGTVKDPHAADGFYLRRKSRVFGRWTENGGWYPDHTLRLFRRSAYRAERAEVHGGFAVDGTTGSLRGTLFHYTYDSIEHYLSKMNDYTSLQVSDKLRGNDRASAGVKKIVLSPLSHFVRKFFVHKGYRDGVHGFVLAVLGSISTLSLYAKLWEYRMRVSEGKGILPPITNRDIHTLKRLHYDEDRPTPGHVTTPATGS